MTIFDLSTPELSGLRDKRFFKLRHRQIGEIHYDSVDLNFRRNVASLMETDPKVYPLASVLNDKPILHHVRTRSPYCFRDPSMSRRTKRN